MEALASDRATCPREKEDAGGLRTPHRRTYRRGHQVNRLAFFVALVGLACRPALAGDDGFIKTIILIDRYDAVGRDLYEGQMQYLATRRAEFCRKMGDTCPPPKRMQGLAIIGTKSRLQKRMDEGRDHLAEQMGGDQASRVKADAIFGAIRKGVLEDMDKLGQ